MDTNISQNISKIIKDINKYSSYPSEVKLVAVTKNRGAKEIEKAIQAGIKIIGENRIQEAKNKLSYLTPSVEKHFIGHLQTNKVKEAVKLFDLIESVDSLKLAKVINKEAQKIGKIMPILLQVNVSQDSAKFGWQSLEVIEAVKKVALFSHVKLQGLMTIGKLTININEIKSYFSELRQLFEKVKVAKIPRVELKYLSMGMSDDYKIALQEGSNMIRIGKAIFEEV